MRPDSFKWFTWDGDRDCPGNPARTPGCRCINHRPDLYLNTTATITGATICTAGVVPNTTGAMTWPPSSYSPYSAYPVTVWPPR